MGKKIYIFIILFIVLVAVVTGAYFVIKNVEENTVFVPNSDSQIKNVKKYEKKLLEVYNKEGKKEEFIKLADLMQEKSLTYVLDNITEDEESFNNNVKQVQKLYNDKDFVKLGLNYDDINYWVGIWSMDDKGNIKFKFASDGIKPTWTTDNDVSKFLY